MTLFLAVSSRPLWDNEEKGRALRWEIVFHIHFGFYTVEEKGKGATWLPLAFQWKKKPTSEKKERRERNGRGLAAWVSFEANRCRTTQPRVKALFFLFPFSFFPTCFSLSVPLPSLFLAMASHNTLLVCVSLSTCWVSIQSAGLAAPVQTLSLTPRRPTRQLGSLLIH